MDQQQRKLTSKHDGDQNMNYNYRLQEVEDQNMNYNGSFFHKIAGKEKLVNSCIITSATGY